MNADLFICKAFFEDDAHAVRPARVPGVVVIFIHHSVEKSCNTVQQVSDALCTTVDFAMFNHSLCELQRVDGVCVVVIGGKENTERCKKVFHMSVF